MATISRRNATYQVQIRRKGSPTLSKRSGFENLNKAISGNSVDNLG
jgi:hypothetical protein